jgi:hypothetical protein
MQRLVRKVRKVRKRCANVQICEFANGLTDMKMLKDRYQILADFLLRVNPHIRTYSNPHILSEFFALFLLQWQPLSF